MSLSLLECGSRYNLENDLGENGLQHLLCEEVNAFAAIQQLFWHLGPMIHKTFITS